MNLEFYIRLKEMVSSGLAKMADTARKASAAVKGSNDTIIQSYDLIQKKIREYENTIRKSTSVQQIRAARAELEKLRAVANSHPGGNGSKSWLKGLARDLLPVISVAGAMALGSAAVKTTLQNDSANRAVNFATNGHGVEAIASVKGINDKYGLSDEAGIEGFKTLAGSVRSLNIPLQETLRIYDSVGAAAAAMGVDAESQKGIYLALGQIASKGTVSAEELRGQIGERLPGAFGIAAKAMGVTEKELGKMMQAGELASKDFLPRFATELQNTFGKAALENADSPSAVFNRFNNVLREVSITVGSILIPPITALMSVFMTIVSWVKENSAALQFLTVVLGTMAAVYGLSLLVVNAGTIAMSIATAVTTGWATAVGWLNAAWAANPIGIVIALVAALVAGIIYAWKNFEGFRKVVWGLWESFKQVFTNIGDFFKRIFAPIFEAIQAFREGRFLDATKAVGKMAYNISPVGLAANAAQYAAEGGFTKGVKDAWARGQEKGKNKEGESTAQASPATIGNAFGMAASSTKPSNDGESTARGIAGGGPRVININGVKFAEKIEVHNMTAKENADELQKIFEEMFLRVLNSGAALQ